MDGVKEEGKVQRERNNGGEAGRGRAWSEGGLGGRERRNERGEAGVWGRAWGEGGSAG